MTEIHFVEQNIDGCGTDATVPVLFPDGLTDDEVSILQDCLHQATENRPAETWDTDSIVADALAEFTKHCPKEYAYGSNCVTLTFPE